MASQSGNDSPLHSAVRLGQLEEVRRILDEPDMDVNCLNSNRETPIHLACALGHPSIIELLMSFGANVFIKDSNNKDCYGRMTSDKVCNLVNKLLCSPSFWLNGPKLTENDTPLHDTVRLGQLETVQDILDQKSVGVNDKNSAHEIPLHLACAIGHNGIVHILMTNGANMYARDTYNNAPIHRAASMGHISIVDMLITEFGCDPMIRGYQGRSLLHFACGSGNVKLIELVLQRKLVDPVIDRDACGCTPLHIAALCGHNEVINMLTFTFNCPVDCKNEGAEIPLHAACINGHINVVELLVLEHNADLNAHNFQSDSPLQLAAVFGHTNVIKTLISDYNCNPHEKGFEGTTILHKACNFGHVELTEILITDFGLDPMCVDDDGNIPLHYAAANGYLSIVRMLMSQHNADLNAYNNLNDSPLQLAATGGHTSIVKVFINDFNGNPNEKGFEGRTILHRACEFGHVELAKILITDFGLDPMCMDDNENTPLHYAAGRGHLSIVRMLMLQHNADLNAYNNQNNLPLQLAAAGGHTSIMKALINDANCNPNEKGFKGRTILHRACEFGHVDLAEILITDFGLDPMCMDDNENTPLHYAAWGGHLSIVSMLMSQHNADLNAYNNQNDSPLQLAASHGHTSVVKAMVSELNSKEGLQSQTAITALCRKKGCEELAITLIADLVCLSPLSTDSDGNTLLHIAAMHEQEQCVYMLMYTYDAPIFLRNNAGKTARETTKLSSIRELIDNYLKKNQGNIQSSYNKLQLLSSKKYSGEQRLTRVFVVGNVLSGKSTLIESLKREGFFSSLSQVSENTVPLHTSGIVPSIHRSKAIGRVLYYDFAGDQEYYSSHSAIMSSVMQSKVGTNAFLIVVNFSKDINKIQEELGYWLHFISYHNKSASQSTCTVVIIGSHVDRITATDMNGKLKGLSRFVQTHFSKLLNGNIEVYSDILTLNCRQPRSTQCVRDAIFQISKDAPSYNLSLEAAILLGLLEKDFKNVVTCKVQSLLNHIKETKICLPATVEYLYPVIEQLHNVGLLMIIGRYYDKLEENALLLNISKLTNEVHKLLFSNPTLPVDDDPNLHARLSMGVLPQSYLERILPEYITTDCLIQLQYCQSFNHVEVKFDHVTPAKPNSSGSTLFYFPALCTSERKKSIVTPDDFNYYIGYFAECEAKFEYFPPRFLHVLLLRLAYSYALQAAKENVATSVLESVAMLQKCNRRCTMWKNGIHWLMQEGVECFVESVNNSKGIVVITKSKDEEKSACSEMLFKIVREFQQVKEEVCETVLLQQYILDSDNPASCSDRNKLFAMSEVEQVLRERKPSIVSISGRGHLYTAKVVLLMKYNLWSKYIHVP